MTSTSIRFDNGAAYACYMGVWSQLVGASFLHWLTPALNGRWLDVGCGNGAFTELIVQQCQPQAVWGIDPSAEQLQYAQAHCTSPLVQWQQADAMALPFADHTFDVSVMPLVIFFVPDPARGIAEMVRVTATGGTVCAYSWDMLGGGFPYYVLHLEMRALGMDVPSPPNMQASHMDELLRLWSDEGLQHIQTRAITVQRTFVDFDDYWQTVLGAPSVGAQLAALPLDASILLQQRMHTRLGVKTGQPIVCHATANAIQGRV